jgi:hypothetical protein
VDLKSDIASATAAVINIVMKSAHISTSPSAVYSGPLAGSDMCLFAGGA